MMKGSKPTMTDDNAWLALCDDIDDGEYDKGLSEIAKAVSSRLDIVSRRNARRMMRELAVSDRVKLTNGVKPRYLEGMIGTILEMRDGAAVVKLDRMPSHRGAGRPPEGGYKDKLLVPFENLVKVDSNITELSQVDEAADIGDDDELDDEDE